MPTLPNPFVDPTQWDDSKPFIQNMLREIGEQVAIVARERDALLDPLPLCLRPEFAPIAHAIVRR